MMSDGPYKSLLMPPGWKRLAKLAEREAFSDGQLDAALQTALGDDWRQEISPTLVRQVEEILSTGQPDLFSDRTTLLELLRNEEPGQPLRATFLDYAMLSVNKGLLGDMALVEAASRGLGDRALRGIRTTTGRPPRETLRSQYANEYKTLLTD